MMGPFRVVNNTDKQGQENFTIVDRWNDFAATVDTQEHADAWIELFYKTLELKEQFAGVDSKRLQRYIELRRAPRKAKSQKPAIQQPSKRPWRNRLKLSCGAVITLGAAA